MNAVLYLAHGAFFLASLCVVDWLEKKKIITSYALLIIIFIVVQIIPVYLPDIVTIIIAVAMAAGYIGWRIGQKK